MFDESVVVFEIRLKGFIRWYIAIEWPVGGELEAFVKSERFTRNAVQASIERLRCLEARIKGERKHPVKKQAAKKRPPRKKQAKKKQSKKPAKKGTWLGRKRRR